MHLCRAETGALLSHCTVSWISSSRCAETTALVMAVVVCGRHKEFQLPLQGRCILDKCPCVVAAATVFLWWPQCSTLFYFPLVAELVLLLSFKLINPLT